MKQRESNREDAPAVDSTIELERQVLGAVCRGTREGSIKELATSLLARYCWRDPVHAAVFDIAMSFPASNPAALKEQLPARLTRRGFPDFDIAALFALPQPTHQEATGWMHRLRELSEDARDDR